MPSSRVIGCVVAFAVSAAAEAGYVIAPVVSGASEAVAAPGEPVVIDLVLTRSAGETHNSSIFRVTFSAPGLVYLGYDWKPPYVNGTIDDFSIPSAAALPTVLGAGTLARPGDPPGVVDIELSNVTPFATSFADGVIASLTVMFPIGYGGADTILIGVVPDTFQQGTQPPVPTSAGSPLEFRLVPSPSAAGVLLLPVAAAFARRRTRDAI